MFIIGEKLGMNLDVKDDSSVTVINVTENGAANRASDFDGNSCPIRAKDEITEINGVSLKVFYYFKYTFKILI